ncbi:hypothetical protein S40285_00357 [Stachybotrys chlorohalonatus IBT 40285]|uniref:Uncharacterized protein n=1 Tax=Stachybotrys chlorohalonatus (strain IBT 40285) TaxID=1283841 RepID=A0A084QHM9_STAC4|nr:hypothetical protein S40285_00357 [Stachybotrys chlorohalonata IBT 40285]
MHTEAALQPAFDEPGALDESVCHDEDEALAVLQPAISAAASRLTSAATPAAEKAAALDMVPDGGLFNDASQLDQGAEDSPGSPTQSSAEVTPRFGRSPLASPDLSTPRGQLSPNLHPTPTPWRASPKKMVVDEPRSPTSRSVLETAFGTTRRRSGSAGQEALRRLSKAFPSFSPWNRSSTLLSNFTDRSNQSGANTRLSSHATQGASPSPLNGPSLVSNTASPSRPPVLRRVTSDDHLLYHSLSRSSSLGDDEQFHDVREMVNMRLVALKESLPERPNLRMPSLAKLQAASKRSSSSLNTNSAANPSAAPQALDSEATTTKDPYGILDGVLSQLTGDIVVMGGYRGSVLRSATPPHQQYWAPVKIGLNLRKANLELGLDPEDEEKSEQSIISSGMVQHIGPIDPDLFSGVLYAGVPQRCINVLGPIRNGDVILFNEKLLTPQVNLSVRTSFVFLPEDGFCFVDKNTRESYPINFFDPLEWDKWRLSPCLQPPLPAHTRPPPTGFSSFLPSSLRTRADSRPDKPAMDPSAQKDRAIAPQMNTGTTATTTNNAPPISGYDRQQYLEYLARVLPETRRFRTELAHSVSHQEKNAYPPFAIIYGKTIPTVYAAQVNGREAIPCSDCYDELLFRPGDGVVLAKEAMLPEGYSLVRGGRISTERGHITMLGDMPAVGRALHAIVRGRRKGIGLGERNHSSTC